jgi:hypothetical protein
MPSGKPLQRLLTLAVLLALAHPAFAQNGPQIGPPAGGGSGDIPGLLAQIQANADWEGTWKPVVKVVVELLIGLGAVVAINSVGHAIQKMVGYVLVFLVAGLLIAYVQTL